MLAKRMQLSDSLWWFVLNMSADEPRDALVARLVDRLGVAVGGEDVAALASVLRDVPPLATNVKLTVSPAVGHSTSTRHLMLILSCDNH